MLEGTLDDVCEGGGAEFEGDVEEALGLLLDVVADDWIAISIFVMA